MVEKLGRSFKIVGYVSYLAMRVYLGIIFSECIDILATLVPDEDFYTWLS